jgi:hypothetical protein
MRQMTRSLLAVAGAVLLSFCGNNPDKPDGGIPDGGGSVGTVNVNGKVVSFFGEVSPNVTVVIKSGAVFSVSTRTDGSGNFTVANVPTPYDATVIDTEVNESVPSTVTVSVGLTSARPTVFDWFSTGTPSSGGGSASLSGAVTGGIGFPSPMGYRTSVLFSSAELQTAPWLAADNTTGDYTTDSYFDDGTLFRIGWSGPTTTTGTLHALQWQQTDTADPFNVHVPNSYSGYGFEENVTLANMSNVSQDIALTPVTPATFAGTYTAPTGYAVDHKAVALSFSSGGQMLIVDDQDATEPFSYPTPNIPGATLILLSTASKGAAYSVSFANGLAVDGTGITVTSPAAAELSTPLDMATGVTTSTPFSWTALPGVVHLVIVSSGGQGPTYIFLTSGTSVTMPDLTSVGVGLPASAAYDWAVYGVGPYADVEAACVGLAGEHAWGSFINFIHGYLVNSNTGGFMTTSLTRSFTTAP